MADYYGLEDEPKDDHGLESSLAGSNNFSRALTELLKLADNRDFFTTEQRQYFWNLYTLFMDGLIATEEQVAELKAIRERVPEFEGDMMGLPPDEEIEDRLENLIAWITEKIEDEDGEAA